MLRSVEPSARHHRPITWTAVGVTAALVMGGGWPAEAAPDEGARAVADGGASAVSGPRVDRPAPVTPTVTQTGVPAVAVSNEASDGISTLSTTARKPTGGRVAGHLRHRVDGASLVGVTWAAGTAPPGLEVRVRALNDGAWSRWTDIHIHADEGPSATEEALVRAGTEPVWVGPSRSVEVTVYSNTGAMPEATRLQAVDPGAPSVDATASTLAADGADTQALAPTVSTRATGAARAANSAAGSFPSMPDIVTRRQWGADERLGDQCYSPRYGSTFKMVFVHHTAGSNSYSRYESAAVVRGVYAYHTQSQGWCDIGYNFLVDRYGKIYEGRDGGMRRAVRGAHSGDYNLNTTGISLMGNFETTSPTKAMKGALVRLIAWRMGTAYHGGYGSSVVAGDRFKRISGHRDAMSTACPGRYAYGWLPRLRERVADRLGGWESMIQQRWQARGGAGSKWGTVKIGEQAEAGGRRTLFQGGRMYRWNGEVRTFPNSPLLFRYVRSGQGTGRLGYPVSGVRSPRHGLAADFADGSIFWAERPGSRLLKASAVLKKYRAVDAAEGRLGFPTSGVRDTRYGARATFQHGAITYNASTRRATVTYT